MSDATERRAEANQLNREQGLRDLETSLRGSLERSQAAFREQETPEQQVERLLAEQREGVAANVEKRGCCLRCKAGSGRGTHQPCCAVIVAARIREGRL